MWSRKRMVFQKKDNYLKKRGSCYVMIIKKMREIAFNEESSIYNQ